MKHRETCALRWRDMDMLGHLNQSVYHELLEEARGAYMIEVLKAGPFVLARVELDYRQEVRKDHDQVHIDVWLDRVGTKSVTLANEIVRPDGVVAASGTTVLVAWDLEARGARTFTDAEREAFSAATAASAG